MKKKKQKKNIPVIFLAILKTVFKRSEGKDLKLVVCTTLHYELIPHSFSIRATSSYQLTWSDVMIVNK